MYCSVYQDQDKDQFTDLSIAICSSFHKTAFQTSNPNAVVLVRSSPPFKDEGCVLVLCCNDCPRPILCFVFSNRAAMTVQDLFKPHREGGGDEKGLMVGPAPILDTHNQRLLMTIIIRLN